MPSNQLPPTVEERVVSLVALVAEVIALVKSYISSVTASVSSTLNYKDGAEAANTAASAARDAAEGHADRAEVAESNLLSNTVFQNMSGIDAVLAAYYVDAFIYDTTQDDDPNWIYRCEHLSWYKEPLGTAIRGTTRQFPALSLIVVRNQTVEIHSLDSGAPEMWMIFNSTASSMLACSAANPHTSVAMKNGELVVGSKLYGIAVANFLKDECDVYWNNNGRYKADGTISKRGEVFVAGSSATTRIASATLPNREVLCLALHTPKGGVIGATSKMRRPIICVGTQAGGAIIHPDETIANVLAAYGYMQDVNVSEDGRIFFTGGNVVAFRTLILNAPTRVDQATPDGQFTAATIPKRPGGDGGDGTSNHNAVIPHGFAVGSVNFGIHVVQENPTDFSKSMLATVHKDYPTGWQVGDIKSCIMADTDATAISDAALNDPSNVSGQFTQTEDGFTFTTTEIICDGVDNFERARISGALIGAPIGTAITVEFDVSSYTSGSVSLSFSNSGGSDSPALNAVGSYSFTGVNTVDDNIIWKSAYFNGTITNIRIKLAIPDRSHNENPLNIVGSLNRTPVAANSELVGYSGFSATNYGHQPYNSDLDFGTGDLSIMGWFKQETGSTAFLFSRQQRDTLGNNYGSGYNMGAFISSGELYVTVGGSYLNSNSAHLGEWTHFAVSRIDGVATLYLNGRPTETQTQSTDISNVSAELLMGVADNDGAIKFPVDGGLALWRFSKTGLTAEQVAHAYETEKALFHEGAKCTLQGAAILISDVEYDEFSDTLYVGHLDGYNKMKGLLVEDFVTDAPYYGMAVNNGIVATQFNSLTIKGPPINLRAKAIEPRKTERPSIPPVIYEFSGNVGDDIVVLPQGYRARKDVGVSLTGLDKIEGAADGYTEEPDGFLYPIKFSVLPANGARAKIAVESI